MPSIIQADERTYQTEFYKGLFGDAWESRITVDRGTDGYSNGILFEHKINVRSYGEAKALSQALIYLCRFNRDGIPVPRWICLVSQNTNECIIYDSRKYAAYINNIPEYANLRASDGIPNFHNKVGAPHKTIGYSLGNASAMRELLDFVEMPAEYFKVDINEHNVYGWSTYYYEHAREHKQRDTKTKFFEELRVPKGTLKDFIKPWGGQETDFKLIMDLLNDPMTQKKLGAFYTPPLYAEKAAELVREAISRVPEGYDYVIIDRCAGTGNLEKALDGNDGDDILSHLIVSTYELKEWVVLKDRFGSRVRYIVPPIPATSGEYPALNNEGFLAGANALTRDLLDNPVIRQYVDNPHCSIILFENPPYGETTSAEFQRRGIAKSSSGWKESYVVQEMKQEVKGAATNDMSNAFIWSAFKYFLRQETDSYVVFSPVKYWKSQHLVKKRFIRGFGFNRRHFHTNTDACIMVALWSNENDDDTDSIMIDGFDIIDGHLTEPVTLPVRQVKSLFSDEYYDKRTFPDDTIDGILAELTGIEDFKHTEKQRRTKPLYNENIIGYLVANQSGFDNPDLNSVMTRVGAYGGNGFFLRKDKYLSRLPLFAAGRYISYNKAWTERTRVMKSGDGRVAYERDIQSGDLDDFLCQCLLWCSMTEHSHMRSIDGSDGRLYRNELCFDEGTLARTRYEQFIADGYTPTDDDKKLIEKYDLLMSLIKEKDDNGDYKVEEYNSSFTYGLYQISKEIDIDIPMVDNNGNIIYQGNGKPKMEKKYGDIHNLVTTLKKMVKDYYLKHLVSPLFQYELLK